MAVAAGRTEHTGPSIKTKQWSVAIMSTLEFIACFAVWMMFGVIGIPIKKELALNATQFGPLTATPRAAEFSLQS
jgi:MFS transporter, NNP family, nitrate/nitrite transporter